MLYKQTVKKFQLVLKGYSRNEFYSIVILIVMMLIKTKSSICTIRHTIKINMYFTGNLVATHPAC